MGRKIQNFIGFLNESESIPNIDNYQTKFLEFKKVSIINWFNQNKIKGEIEDADISPNVYGGVNKEKNLTIDFSDGVFKYKMIISASQNDFDQDAVDNLTTNGEESEIENIFSKIKIQLKKYSQEDNNIGNLIPTGREFEFIINPSELKPEYINNAIGDLVPYEESEESDLGQQEQEIDYEEETQQLDNQTDEENADF